MTSSTWRRSRSSGSLTTAPRNIVGVTVGSMRRKTPADSSRVKSSSIDAASAIASIWVAVPWSMSGSSVCGCWNLRFIHHASRGRIQRIAAGGTPRSRSHTHVSSAVLPSADDHEALERRLEPSELGRRDAPDAIGHRERRRARRGKRALDVRGVDELSAHAHARRRAREPGDEAVLAHVVAAREITDAPRRQEVTVHDALVVGPELVGAGELVEARVRSDRVDRVLPERHRGDAVESRRLMEPHVRIGVEPMSAGRVASVDDGDRGVRMREERVGERHPRRPGADDEIVGFELRPHHPDDTRAARARGATRRRRGRTPSLAGGVSRRCPS